MYPFEGAVSNRQLTQEEKKKPDIISSVFLPYAALNPSKKCVKDVERERGGGWGKYGNRKWNLSGAFFFSGMCARMCVEWMLRILTV